MIPNLGNLSLNARRKPCRPSIDTSLFQLASGTATDPASCGICLDPLTADTETVRDKWTGQTGRMGPFLRTVCDNDHVFHTGCAVGIVLANLNNPRQLVCPDCRDPLKPAILALAADVVEPPAPDTEVESSGSSSDDDDDMPNAPPPNPAARPKRRQRVRLGLLRIRMRKPF